MLFQQWNWYHENYTFKSTINAVIFFKYNTVVSILMQSCSLPYDWQVDVCGNRLKYIKIFQPCNWYLENYSIVQSQTTTLECSISASHIYSSISHTSTSNSFGSLRSRICIQHIAVYQRNSSSVVFSWYSGVLHQ
jgi:hypothetical protein